MRRAIFWIMLKSLIRDRAALAVSFMLPGVVFTIFAFVFAGASGGALSIRVAVADLRGDAGSEAFLAELFAHDGLRRLPVAGDGREAVVGMVRAGVADVGLVVRDLAGPFSRPPSSGPAHVEMVTDPSREIASAMLSGLVQQAYMQQLPGASSGLGLLDRTSATPAAHAFSAVAYYAGAVAVMFLLFSSLAQALTFVDERQSGLLERIAAGPGGIGIVVDGKFLFIVALGWVQVAIVFAVAWLGFGLALPAHIGPWAVTTLMAAIAAAGLALVFVTLCRTRQQADTLGQMLVVIVSALGGSMVPRFLMPPEVQALGWATPNTWALEAYAGLFWRGDGLEALYLPWAVLAGMGLGALVMARLIAARRSGLAAARPSAGAPSAAGKGRLRRP
jgi:ABC-2 type transport system permease protein